MRSLPVYEMKWYPTVFLNHTKNHLPVSRGKSGESGIEMHFKITQRKKILDRIYRIYRIKEMKREILG
jgi:hypothetical protein